ncbi:MAG: histidinol dehydrogenase [Pseudomonadales bacterium]|nr:histidinol dehydrogenase [Pseudomonadales bacterium]
MISYLDTTAADFSDELNRLLAFAEEDQAEVRGTVLSIIRDVRDRGDAAVLELTNRFDHQSAGSMADLTLDAADLKAAYESLDPLVCDALEESASRVRAYHEAQLRAMGEGEHWQYEDDYGNQLGQRVNAMARVGVYAPGGKAAYPSTIIMTVLPARVAGVEEVVLCVPTPGGEINPVLLAAAHLSGVDRVFSIGGAQAVAAMAYGTESVPRVDKIVGPGNIFVATAKELVFGDVGIDMIAGPSEVVIVADDSVDPDWVIQDMFAQAEHDEMAQAIVISDSAKLLEQIHSRLPDMLAKQSRRNIIETAIRDRGAIIQVADLDEAFDVVNRIAPEHLQLAMADAPGYLERVRHAGAVFLGVDTTEVVGDYTAGPSHVLPTSGTARFASPLGVYDFQTRTSVIHCSRQGSIRLNRAAAIIAAEEGLDAHAESARFRVKG